MIKYTYNSNVFYFNFFKDLYFQDINKKIESDWFYVAKEYMKQTKLNNTVNTFNISLDVLMFSQKKEEIKTFFKENYGKFGKFWIEIPSTSLKLEEDSFIGDNFIIVKNSFNYLSTFNYNRHIAIRKNLKDSNIVNNNLINIQLLKIIDIQKIDENTEKIIFNNNLLFDLSKNEAIISDLFLVRNDSDTLTINKIDNKIYKTNLSFKELQQETI